ncbi:hypothetical protein V8F20_009367 [Naviculisporaceae sp. PSN 640]
MNNRIPPPGSIRLATTKIANGSVILQAQANRAQSPISLSTASMSSSKEQIDRNDPELRRRLEQEGMARLAEDLELDNGFEGFSDVLGLAPAPTLGGRGKNYKLRPLTNRDATTTDIDEHNLKHLRRYVARRRKAGLPIPEITLAQIQDAERRIIAKGGKIPEEEPEEVKEPQKGESSKTAKPKYSKKEAEELGWLVLDKEKHYITN